MSERRCLERIFASMFGERCWRAEAQPDVWLLDFGDPRVVFAERSMRWLPIMGSRRGRRRRGRYPILEGRWGLGICDTGLHATPYVSPRWRYEQDGEFVARPSSPKQRQEAASALLTGQALIGVEIDCVACRTAFWFDLGGCLITWPRVTEPMHTVWVLGRRSAEGKHLCEISMHADGRIVWEQGSVSGVIQATEDHRTDNAVWCMGSSGDTH